jgi:hypothetical protein
MVESLPPYYAFDHVKSGPLEKLANACNVPVLPKGRRHIDERKAIDELLAKGARLLLVHVNEVAWKYLLEKVGEGTSAIRFSTEGFAPKQPAPAGGGCFHCCKKISHDKSGVTADELRELLTFIGDGAQREQILQGVIPPEIEHLLSAKEPHALRALYMNLLGILTVWAHTPGHGKAQKARNVLSTSRSTSGLAPKAWAAAPVAGGAVSGGDEKLGEQVEAEIIAAGGRLTGSVAQLVGALKAGQLTHENPPPEVTLDAFTAIERLVCNRPDASSVKTVSRFNHDWLKNRLLMALNAAEKYDDEDPSLSDLLELLKTWEEYREDLEQALEQCAATPALRTSITAFEAKLDKLESTLEGFAGMVKRKDRRPTPNWKNEMLSLRQAANKLSEQLSALTAKSK